MKFPQEAAEDILEFSYIYVAVFIVVLLFERNASLLDKATLFVACYLAFGALYVAACASCEGSPTAESD